MSRCHERIRCTKEAHHSGEHVFLGATNAYPYGKLNQGDEGELRFAITADLRNGVVLIDFGKDLSWMGLPADMAVRFGEALIAKAKEIKGGSH